MFLSDIHLPDSINLDPVFSYLKDLGPDIVILGGDIVDAKGLHGCESMKAESIDRAWYERDRALLTQFLRRIHENCPKAEIVYLEGNHEERYRRLIQKYPNQFKGEAHLRLYPDAVPDGMRVKWIPYGTYKSYYKLGDMVFIHGTVWPDAHAKRYATDHTPFKVVYGHLHHLQSYTTRTPFEGMEARYAITAGCLTERAPDWKKGAPHQWVNGFVSFITDGRVTTPTVHVIERGRFAVGAKFYGV